MFAIFVSLCLALFTCINAASVHGSKTLVLYDARFGSINEYSQFFDSLKDHSYELSYREVGNQTDAIELYEKDERAYDNLIIFPIKGKHFNKQVHVKTLLKFYEDGGDILAVTAPEGVSDSVRLFLNQLGIYPSPKDEIMVDYTKVKHDVLDVTADRLVDTPVFSAKNPKDYFVFERSSAALLDNRVQIVPILRAPRTAFTDSKNKESWVSGSEGYLVAGFQNLDNARTTWVGSQEFFSNAQSSVNGDFAQEIAKWTFREKNVIKSVGTHHSHADGTLYEETPYKVKDTVVYEIGLTEWNGEKWVPFIADDVQFELRMVDPYYRLTLSPSRESNGAQYYTTGEFNLPDHHGVFTFVTDYKRSGLSFVTESDVKAIRHLANDEYPRSWEITNAWVYISSIYSVIFAWIIFVILFVITSTYSKKVDATKKNN